MRRKNSASELGSERLRIFEGAAAKHPALHQIGMHVAGLFDREVALIDGAETLGAEAHLFVERERAEDLFDSLFGLGVKIRIDAVADEDGEADLVQRIAEVLGEGGLVVGIAVEKPADVDRANLELI